MVSVLTILLSVYLIYNCLAAIWTIYFHPLRNIPGPKLWIVFPFLRYIALVRGRMDINMRAFHNKYGSVIRFGPGVEGYLWIWPAATD